MQLALACWADAFGARIGAPRVRPAPTVWCSWYHYFTEVAEPDILDNLAAIDELDLAIDVVQIDDGYQSEVGDWLSWSDRFGSLGDVVQRIRDRGRRAGIWVAPFVAGARSELAHEHPEWLIGEARVAQNWDQDVFGIDLTHPGARRYLTEVFGTMRGLGIDYFKIDFLYGGALIGRRYADAAPLDAYRSGLELIRSAIGQDAYLLGCGAPMLPSVGLVDAMRSSPDCAPHWD